MHAAICQVCQSGIGNIHRAHEMMLGTRDEFFYMECSDCGCLSLVDVPANLERYYPADYCTFSMRPASLLRRLRNAVYLSPLSFVVNWRRREDFEVIRRVRLNKRMRFLEVGGSGTLLSDLRDLGYDVHGVNSFVQADIADRRGVLIECKSLAEVTGKFDVIMFRHSLEHMTIDALRIAREHISSDGHCVVCIPILGWTWQNYATNWAEIDAPRRRFFHTPKSFSLLARESSFRIDKVVFDTSAFKLWASAFYQQGIPMVRVPQPNRVQSNRLKAFADMLNVTGGGDAAQFYLKPS